MLSLIVATAGGIVGRMILGSLGTALLGLNVDPELASKIVDMAQSLGPAAGSALGIVAIGGAYGWSWWQKKRSGVIPAK